MRRLHREDRAFREHGRKAIVEYNERLRREGKPNPNQPIATAAAKRSPIAGRFETHRLARVWWVISPDGQVHEVRNLMKWCRDNPELFAPDPWKNAYAGLHAVQAWLRGNRKYRVSQWKGWTLERPSVHPNELESD